MQGLTSMLVVHLHTAYDAKVGNAGHAMDEVDGARRVS